MNSYIFFASNKKREQFPVDFEYKYDDILFTKKMIQAVDNYCKGKDFIPDKSVNYKFIMQDGNALHLIAECNAVTFNLYTNVYEIAKHNKDTYDVIYNHRFKDDGYYFWVDDNGLHINLLNFEWDEVLDTELTEIRNKLSNTKVLPCNDSKLKGIEDFFVHKIDIDKNCSVYKKILIKDPKKYRTIDDLWDELEA